VTARLVHRSCRIRKSSANREASGPDQAKTPRLVGEVQHGASDLDRNSWIGIGANSRLDPRRRRAASMPSLSQYRKKRDFERTAEPRGRRAPKRRDAPAAQDEKSYVIHKHSARRLHYDFRLELDGALLSFAVPNPFERMATLRQKLRTES
jgi:hypothetical protein